MKTMFMDTSTQNLFVGFFEDNNIIYYYTQAGNNNHSDYLLTNIENGLKEHDLKVSDFDRIIVGIGPGAYTGLRVGLTVAKMFSWTLNIPLYTISSLDILFTGVKNDGIYPVATKAKKDYVYSKVLEIKNGNYNVLKEEVFLEKTLFLESLKQYNVTKFIDENNFELNLLNLERFITKVEDVTFLEPNYLRGEM